MNTPAGFNVDSLSFLHPNVWFATCINFNILSEEQHLLEVIVRKMT